MFTHAHVGVPVFSGGARGRLAVAATSERSPLGGT